MISEKINEWLERSGFLSKTGMVLLFLGLLLTGISFGKGIQVLMFIPAFVIALFVYSFFDVFFAQRGIQFSWERIRGQKVLSFTFSHPSREYCFFRVLGEEEIPARQSWFSFFLPSSRFVSLPPLPNTNEIPFSPATKRIWVSIQGRLDIFRWKVPLPPFSLSSLSVPSKASDGDRYFVVRPFQPEDSPKRIHALQTAKRGKLMIQDEEIHHRGDDEGGKTANIFQWKSNAEMVRMTDIEKGEMWEWAMIFLGALSCFLEWGNLLFFILPIFGIVLHTFLKKRGFIPLGERRALNVFALFLFAISVGESIFISDTVEAGVHFLLLLGVGKHFFRRERRDGFTYIFLILFVFVALSLFTLRIWFLPFFLFYLLMAVFLFSLYAGGEQEEEYRQYFGRPKTLKSFSTMAIGILLLTIALFLLLPHGNKAKDSSLLGQKEVHQTGFTEEVSLYDMQGIKEDFSKIIVIENAQADEQEAYAEWYWRGARFAYFTGETWKRIENTNKRELYPLGNVLGKGDVYRIKLYTEGGKTLFLPASPVRIETPQKLLFSGIDRSTTSFERAQFSSQVFTLTLQKDPFGLPFDANLFLSPSFTVPPLSPQVEALLTPFWESIPENITKHPGEITRYIKEEAGFSYTMTNPPKNLADFVYGSQKGHCEYFATLLTLTLQHFGYTAVLVNGFSGGEWNTDAGAWIVRGKNAHSWTEVLQNGRWEILDATPPAGASDTLWFEDLPFFKSVIATYDFLDLKWYEYIVNFTGERQKQFFSWIGIHTDTWIKIFIGGIGIWIFSLLYKKWKIFSKIPFGERFLLFLKRQYKIPHFPLLHLSKRFPRLVHQIQSLLYSKKKAIHLNDLKNTWEEGREKES